MFKQSFFVITLLLLLPVMALSAEFVPVSKRFNLGGVEVISLQDSLASMDKKLYPNVSEEIWKKYVKGGAVPASVNVFLVKMSEVWILFDTGTGKGIMASLKKSGIKPEDIKYVFLTHLHKDHFGGLLSNDKLNFPLAKVYVNKVEFEFWKSKGDPFGKVAEKLGDKLNFISDKPILKNISPINLSGHTLGHTGYLIQTNNYPILIWGDIVHGTILQVPNPEIFISYDLDPEQAVKTRQAIFEQGIKNKYYIAATHAPFPGIKRLLRTFQGDYELNKVKPEK